MSIPAARIVSPDLEREHGHLPATIEATTPRGGRHVCLLVPDGHPLPTINAGQLGLGLDHRCQGGYAVAPPSTIFGKSYAWYERQAPALCRRARLAARPSRPPQRRQRQGHATRGMASARAVRRRRGRAQSRHHAIGRPAVPPIARACLGSRTRGLLQPVQVPTAARRGRTQRNSGLHCNPRNQTQGSDP